MVEARHALPWPVPDWKRERHEPSGAVADPGDMGEPRIVHDGDADLTVVVVPSFGYWALDSILASFAFQEANK